MKELRRVSKTLNEWAQNAIASGRVHPGNVARHPERYWRMFAREWAGLQVQRAVKRGDLVKPSHCSDCGSGPLPNTKIQGHHPDYNQPLEIHWLCSKCHHKRHNPRLRFD